MPRDETQGETEGLKHEVCSVTFVQHAEEDVDEIECIGVISSQSRFYTKAEQRAIN